MTERAQSPVSVETIASFKQEAQNAASRTKTFGIFPSRKFLSGETTHVHARTKHDTTSVTIIDAQPKRGKRGDIFTGDTYTVEGTTVKKRQEGYVRTSKKRFKPYEGSDDLYSAVSSETTAQTSPNDIFSSLVSNLQAVTDEELKAATDVLKETKSAKDRKKEDSRRIKTIKTTVKQLMRAHSEVVKSGSYDFDEDKALALDHDGFRVTIVTKMKTNSIEISRTPLESGEGIGATTHYSVHLGSKVIEITPLADVDNARRATTQEKAFLVEALTSLPKSS